MTDKLTLLVMDDDTQIRAESGDALADVLDIEIRWRA